MSNDKTSLNPHHIPSLPEDIIWDILSRLPVKSLLRSRSVCKLWLSVISNPEFVKLHFRKSKHTPSAQHSFIYENKRFNCCSVYSLFNSEPVEPDSPSNKSSEVARDFMDEIVGSSSLAEASAYHVPGISYMQLEKCQNIFWVEVVDSCNGLVCLAIFKHCQYTLFLWNPSTRKSRKLPFWGRNATLGCSAIYGFGYDEINDDYQVVGIYEDIYPNSKGEVKVYSSKSDCWRRIEDFPSALLPLIDHAMFANGAMHWAGKNRAYPHSWTIISLDKREKFVEVPQPRYEEVPKDSNMAVLKGRLCLIHGYATRCELWIMNEYGEQESWTKLVTFPFWYESLCIWKPPTKDSYSRICISIRGHIVFESPVSVYNFNDDKVNKLELRPHHQAVIYTESLVSPEL